LLIRICRFPYLYHYFIIVELELDLIRYNVIKNHNLFKIPTRNKKKIMEIT
jgi:hypothetical protein